MKILDKKKWIIIFAVLAVLAIAARPLDMLIAEKLYRPESIYGTFFLTAAPALAFVLSSFSCAVMMSCRSTRTTRTKNRALTFLFAVLSVLFGAAAGFYPFMGASDINFIVIAAAALLISGASVFIAYTSFRDTYQKIAMTKLAKIILISTAAITVICALATLIPQRGTFEAVKLYMEKYGKADGPFESTVPFLSFAGASTAVAAVLTGLTQVLPKLKFSEKFVFIISCVWTLAVIFCSVMTGKMFLSEAVYGAILGYIIVLAVSVLLEKREKE